MDGTTETCNSGTPKCKTLKTALALAEGNDGGYTITLTKDVTEAASEATTTIGKGGSIVSKDFVPGFRSDKYKVTIGSVTTAPYITVGDGSNAVTLTVTSVEFVIKSGSYGTALGRTNTATDNKLTQNLFKVLASAVLDLYDVTVSGAENINSEDATKFVSAPLTVNVIDASAGTLKLHYCNFTDLSLTDKELLKINTA